MFSLVIPSESRAFIKATNFHQNDEFLIRTINFHEIKQFSSQLRHISSAHEEFCLIQANFCHFSKCDYLACNIIFLVQNWLENMEKRSKIQNLLFGGRNWPFLKFQCKIAQFYLILKKIIFVFFFANISSKWKIIDSMT